MNNGALVKVKNLRISPSDFCELSCGYCHITKSKNNLSTQKNEKLPQAKNLIFACNSFYQPDIQSRLANSTGYDNVSLELHFLTLSLERNQAKLADVAKTEAQWIVHIDHLDPEKIQKLKDWDHKVAEYRVLPSQLYPAVLFLAQLPAFVQKKVKWALLGKDDTTADFPPLSSLSSTISQLKSVPLHDFALSDLNWAPTFEGATPLLRSGLRWTVLDSLAYQSEDWPLQLSLLDSEYVGYLAAPKAAQIDKTISLYDSMFFYFETKTHKKIQNSLANYLPVSEKFYFLENFLVKKEIWRAYLKSYSVYDHWTWTDFLKQKNIHPQSITDLNTQSQLTVGTFHLAIQRHYQLTLDSQFYKSYSLAIHNNKFFRKFSYSFFKFTFSLLALIPHSFLTKISRQKKDIALSIDDLQYSAASNMALLKKVSTFILQRFYWLSHAKYWQGYDIVQKTKGAIYALTIYSYWATYKIAEALHHKSLSTFWWLYANVFTPVTGFFVSLFDFPKSYEQEPWFKRWILKTQLFVKKWLWLILKTARLR